MDDGWKMDGWWMNNGWMMDDEWMMDESTTAVLSPVGTLMQTKERCYTPR
jgi:hypothetical protein